MASGSKPRAGGGPSPAAGYSGTALAKKLGIGDATRIRVLAPPGDYRAMLAPWPSGAEIVAKIDRRTDVVHLFVSERAVLAREAARLRQAMRPDATLWISWPKKAAKVATDLSEDVIRTVVLPLGWVDVKVCAVDAVWAGLKLVVRVELRQ